MNSLYEQYLKDFAISNFAISNFDKEANKPLSYAEWLNSFNGHGMLTKKIDKRPPIYITALKMAKLLAADRSEDIHTKVGAAGIRSDKTLVFAYNGTVSGISIDWTNREEKNKRVIHAEMNLLRYVKPGEIEILVCTHSPCVNCLPVLAGYGIKTIYFEQYYHRNLDVDIIAKEFGIELKQISI